MRRRNLLLAAGAAAVLLAWIGWKTLGGGGGEDTGAGAAAAGAGDPDSPEARRMRAAAGQGVPGQVRGTVRDMTDRRPVPGVDVSFTSILGESTATTGPDGRYVLSLAPGSYRVTAIGDGVVGAGGDRFVLRPGQSVEGHDVWVSRTVALRGMVVDHRGTPVAAAAVTFSARSGGREIRSELVAPVGEAISGDDGRFEIEVPAGDMKLIAQAGEARGEALLTGVVPGQEPAEVVIRLAAGAAVAGRVVDGARSPVAGVEVRIAVLAGGARVGDRTVTTDAAGGFRFDHLAPGRITLEARGAAGVSPPLDLTLADGAEKTGVELVLAAAGAITGRVVDGKGAPVAGASVMATPAKSTIKPGRVTSGGDGTFVLEGLAVGTRHTVQARREGFAHAFARNVVPPAEGIELVLRSAGGVRGVVKARGAPVPSFQVEVARYVELDGKPRPGGASSRFTSKDGRFELDLVNPGDYDLVVTAEGFAPARPPRVTVPPDGWAEIEVELAAGARVSGRVTSSGQPVAGARVAMSAAYAGPPVFTDAQGRFTLNDVAPGRRSISASKTGLVSAHRDDLEIAAGQSVEVELVLRPSGDKKEGGIGVNLAASTQARPQIKSTFSRLPGYRAGLRKGDLVMSIDGIDTVGMPFDRAAALLRGPVGTAVRVEVERADRVLRFDVVRAPE